MDFVHHIVCRDPVNNGFVVKVTPERYNEDSSDGDHWQERWVLLVLLFFPCNVAFHKIIYPGKCMSAPHDVPFYKEIHGTVRSMNLITDV